MTATHDIVQKLWNLCHVLRDDGITYHQYVTELTYLLFLKMAQETGMEEADSGDKVFIPEEFRWKTLTKIKDNVELLDHYRRLLVDIAGKESGASSRVKAIYANAATNIRQPKNLATIIKNIDGLDWYNARQEGLGDLYEGLLEKNAEEKKSGAGQYFTPRPLIDTMVDLIKPQSGEHVQDPAIGTGGFLVAADRYIKERTDSLFDLKKSEQDFQKKEAFYGMELVQDTHRLALMNAMLHGIEGDIIYGDTLGNAGKNLPPANVILTNPPFGTKKGGGKPTRDDFTYPTSNKQLAFLQHIYKSLKPGGRAAVVLPDNVLFEDNVGQKVRADLMDKCNLHTILRLPTGIFYAQGVKTNVLFFHKSPDPTKDKGNTKEVWIYDMRTNMPSFGKRTPLKREHFKEFEKTFGDDPLGLSPRTDEGEEGRFRKFTREEIKKRGDNLDITWLQDDSIERAEDLPEPDEIAAEIVANLQTAMEEMEALAELLEGGE